MIIIQIKLFQPHLLLGAQEGSQLKTKEIVKIKKQLTAIHEQIDTMVSKGEEREALILFSKSITNLKVSNITKD